MSQVEPIMIDEEALPGEYDSQAPKEDDVNYCKVCHVDTKTKAGFQNHLKGMMHITRTMAMDKKAEEIVARQEVEERMNELPPSKKYGGYKADKLDQGDPDGFYCEVCDCRMTGPQNFKAHLDGSKHKKNEAKGGVVKGPSGKGNVEMLSHFLETCEEPIVGMKYITEFQPQSANGQPRYVCNLCEVKCDVATVRTHVLGYKHRFAYIKEHYMNYYVLIRQEQVPKAQLHQVIEEYAAEIEAQEGRGGMKVKAEVDPFFNNTSKTISHGSSDYIPPPAKRMRDEGGRDSFGMGDISLAGNMIELIKLMERDTIRNEEEASLALQLSDKLTNAVMTFRVRTMPSGVSARLADEVDNAPGRRPRFDDRGERGRMGRMGNDYEDEFRGYENELRGMRNIPQPPWHQKDEPMPLMGGMRGGGRRGDDMGNGDRMMGDRMRPRMDDRGMGGDRERGMIGGERGMIGRERSMMDRERAMMGGDRAMMGGDRAMMGGDRDLIGRERGMSGGNSIMGGERGGVRSLVGGDRAMMGGERGGARSLVGGDRAMMGGERGGVRSLVGDNPGTKTLMGMRGGAARDPYDRDPLTEDPRARMAVANPRMAMGRGGGEEAYDGGYNKRNPRSAWYD